MPKFSSQIQCSQFQKLKKILCRGSGRTDGVLAFEEVDPGFGLSVVARQRLALRVCRVETRAQRGSLVLQAAHVYRQRSHLLSHRIKLACVKRWKEDRIRVYVLQNSGSGSVE